MGTVIHLLGVPRVLRDGRAQQAPRGNKAWGLLAYLLLTGHPVSRRRLCSLLFAEADDPLATLRWNLTVLRRLLGDPESLRGDPLAFGSSSEVVADVQVMVSGTWAEAESVGGLGLELLESMSFPSCPSFEVWLEAERRHLRGATEAMLHETALLRLAVGDASRAADLAGHLVRLNPYEENFQALLVRALAASGAGVAAARQAAACRELFRRELGVEPGPTLAAAAATVTATPTAMAATGPGAVVALIDAGSAAVGSGVLDAGLQCLRRAVVDARALTDAGLQARALVALGGALVHAAVGRDEEGATSLHEALATVSEGGRFAGVVAEASRELGYVEFLRGRYDRVEVWLDRAEAAAGSDASERARILTVRGSSMSDIGRYGSALRTLQQAIALSADDCGGASRDLR